MTVDQILAQVRGRVFDSTTTKDFGDADIVAWIDAAQLEFACRTKCLEEIGTTDIVSGVSEYDLPWNCLVVVRVGAPAGKVDEGTLAEYDKWVEEHTSYDTTISRYLVWNDMIRVWPAPNEDVAAGLNLHYIRRPETLALGATPEIPTEYHDALSSYATARAKMNDGELAEAATYQGQFEACVRRFKSEKRKTSDGTAQIRDVE